MAILFQYGSNCSETQINSPDRLCGDAIFVDIAETVHDYRITFDVFSRKRGCAAADIIPSPGHKVWGVLYEVPDWLVDRKSAKKRNRKSLDAIEGEGTNYRRIDTDVRRPGGQLIKAVTYVVIDPKPGLQTSLEYVSHIVVGLRDRGVDVAYIDTVKSIAAQNNPGICADLRRL